MATETLQNNDTDQSNTELNDERIYESYRDAHIDTQAQMMQDNSIREAVGRHVTKGNQAALEQARKDIEDALKDNHWSHPEQ